VLLLSLTLLVVLRQLFVTQRHTEILVRQDELNQEVLSRKIRLLMYAKPEPLGQLVVFCRNDGNKTVQNFEATLLGGKNVVGGQLLRAWV